MTALQQARAHLALLDDAFEEGDLERANLLGDELGDDLDGVAREQRPRVGDDLCVTCESDCARVTFVRRRVRELEDDLLLVSRALREERELRDTARHEIDRRFPPAVAA